MADRTGNTPPPPVRTGRPRVTARVLLAVLLLAMAASQLSHVAGFAEVLGGYRFLPEPLLEPAALTLAVSEAMAGIALLSGRRCGGTLALAVAVAWSVLAAQAFGRGLAVENCGCFGVRLGQPLRWWVLLQDAYFVALAAHVRRAERWGPRPAVARPLSSRHLWSIPARSSASHQD